MSAPIRIAHEGPSTDLSALTVFRPALTTLVLQTGSRLRTDELGVSTITRRWKCRRDLAEGFLARRGDRDFQWKDLRLVDYETVDEGAITTIEEVYNGFVGGAREPEPLERETDREQEVTLYNASGSLTLVYMAPTLTRLWATDDRKKLIVRDPYSYNGFNRPVRKLHFRNVNGIPITATGATEAILRLFKWELKSIRRVDAQPDGHVWRATEVIERRIVQEIDNAANVLISAVAGLV